MNYRHIFHAGNTCDVVKHAVLTLILEHLRGKEKGFFVLDTHAGTGGYDLQDPRALKTNEAAEGIFKFLSSPPVPELEGYYRILKELNPDLPLESGLRFYPGSPLITTQLLRPQDRLVACEAHEEDAQELKQCFYGNKQVFIHWRDGYEALRAFLPPPEKRGLVLIDPPYEATNECETLVKALADAHKRWAQGIYMIWYPIKERAAIWRFHEQLAATGIPSQLYAEFIYQDETRHDRLNGSGLILINPPWQMDEKLQRVFAGLHKALRTDYRQSVVKWLVNP